MFLTDRNIIVLEQVDSTNNYAKQLLSEKPDVGTVVLAHYQNKGRGQMGNFWDSEAGKNLLFSTILYPDYLEAGKQFYISKIVSIALAEVLTTFVEDVKIKWPNDIYVGQKKIAGILIENTIKGMQLETSVVGVGLNLNQELFAPVIPNPVSLKILTGKEYDVKEVLSMLLTKLKDYEKWLKDGKQDEIDNIYMSALFRGQNWHLYRDKSDEFEAKISGIGSYGQLQLKVRSGEIREYMFKEVEFVV